MDNTFTEQLVEVMNKLNGRRLWEIRDGKLCSNAMAKATTIHNPDGTSNKDQDVKKIYSNEEAITNLEEAIIVNEKTCSVGRELLKEARKAQAAEALANITRMFGKEVTEKVLQDHMNYPDASIT